MAHLSRKRIIWLVVILVVITIGLLWFVGYQNKKDRAARLEKYTKEFLDKQKNIEAVAVKGLQNNEPVSSPIEQTPALIVSTSTVSTTDQLHNYGVAVALALKPLSIARANEPNAVLTAIDKNDRSLLRSVTESRIYHQAAAQDMAKIIVPRELLSRHNKIISSLNFLASILGNMEKATDQPQPALNNSQSFMTNYLILVSQINDLNKYLTDHNAQIDPNNKIKIFMSFSK